MSSLDGRVAIVAGVGDGVGTAAARALAGEGASVVLAARTGAVIDELAASLAGPAMAVHADVTDPAACARLVDETLERFGRLDVVAVNVGAIGPRAATADAVPAAWLELLDLNALGPLRLVQSALPALRASPGAAVVFVGSMVVRAHRHHPGRGAYAASKAALQSIAHTLAEELGPSGIRVNTIAPGWIWGPALIEGAAAQRAAATSRSLDEVHEELAASTPLRRLPRPSDVADAVAFLASDRAAAITGQTLHVNSGEVFG